MTQIWYESDGDLEVLDGLQVAVVGYGNQGRSWALNLRDSELGPLVCVRNDDSRAHAERDGFAVADLEAASDADVVCVLIPDDVIPSLPYTPKDTACTIVASGYTYAFERFLPPGDLGMIAPRMLGPEVRRCYEEGAGFITAVGIHRDSTGRALELSATQEAVLDLAVEQVLSPALAAVNNAFVATMIEEGIPLEAIITELVLSGEIERTYRLLRESGYAAQAEFHSPTSQYGQLSRRGRYDHLDLASTMRSLTDDITTGRFADEWDAERDAGYPLLTSLKEQHTGPGVREFEADLRTKLGPGVNHT
jgi:ketol-acid reductoisomerase